MHRLFRWLIGYMEFTFSDGFCDGFINECYKLKINIHNVKINNNILTAESFAQALPEIESAAEKHGGKINVTSRRGLSCYVSPLWKRPGITAGVLAFIIIINFFGGYVWDLKIVGNDVLSDARLEQFLSENGLYVGARWNDIDRDRTEALMLASFDECAWVHINRFGTTAQIEINEAVKKPETALTGEPYSLTAKKDGVIVKATVSEGWQLVKKGDAVVKGEMLVSGVSLSKDEKQNIYAHARGEFLAEVKEPISITVSRAQSEKLYTSEKKYTQLYFFGLHIPLYIGPLPSNDCEIKSETRMLRLNSKSVPLGICKKRVRLFTVKERVLSDGELTALIKRETEKDISARFSKEQVISRKINITLSSSDAQAKGCIICIEDIAKETPM